LINNFLGLHIAYRQRLTALKMLKIRGCFGLAYSDMTNKVNMKTLC